MTSIKPIHFLLLIMTACMVFFPFGCSKVDSIPRVDFTLDLTTGTVADVQGGYQQQVPDFDKLSLTGGWVYVNGLILFKGIDLNYYALSQYCPNDACNLEYQVSYDRVYCPCDGSLFDIDGTVTMGPASVSLYRYATSLSGTLLHVYTP
jgi:nitrite reductase/ring-hydroxylating ferredoxin subunit